MLWIALAFAQPVTGADANPAAAAHSLTINVKSPPAGAVVEATAFGETLALKDPGVGVHTATFKSPPERFTRLSLDLDQNGVRTPIYDGVLPLSDATADVVGFVVTSGARPTALRTAYAPSGIVRTWTEPGSVTRYGWGAILAAYAALLLFASTRRA